MKRVLRLNRAKCTKELDNALLQARNEIGPVDKNAILQGRKYSHINDVMETIEQALFNWQLVVRSRRLIKKGVELYRTTIKHAPSGRSISDTRLFAPDRIFKDGGTKIMTPIQSDGAFETYTRRYALIALLGLRGADDTDGADIEVKEVKYIPKESNFVTVDMIEELLNKIPDGDRIRSETLKKNNQKEIKFLKQGIKKLLYDYLLKKTLNQEE